MTNSGTKVSVYGRDDRDRQNGAFFRIACKSSVRSRLLLGFDWWDWIGLDWIGLDWIGSEGEDCMYVPKWR